MDGWMDGWVTSPDFVSHLNAEDRERALLPSATTAQGQYRRKSRNETGEVFARHMHTTESKLKTHSSNTKMRVVHCMRRTKVER